MKTNGMHTIRMKAWNSGVLTVGTRYWSDMSELDRRLDTVMKDKEEIINELQCICQPLCNVRLGGRSCKISRECSKI